MKEKNFAHNYDFASAFNKPVNVVKKNKINWLFMAVNIAAFMGVIGMHYSFNSKTEVSDSPPVTTNATNEVLSSVLQLSSTIAMQRLLEPNAGPYIPASRDRLWLMKAGTSLKDNMTELAKNEGLILVWKAKDQVLAEPGVFSGELISNKGVITQIGSKYGMAFSLHGDVLVVTNSKG